MRFTVGKDGKRYVIALSWPGRELVIDQASPISDGARIVLLGGDQRPLDWHRSGSKVTITMPAGGNAKRATRSQHAYAFRISPA